MSTWEKQTQILEVKDVVSGYGSMNVLHGITLSVEAGTIVGLIGSNGAGKSTLLRTVSGLIQPTQGVVYFKSQNITKMASHKVFKMGMAHVPENRGLFGPLTVYENLKLGCYPELKQLGKNGLKKRMDEVFALFPRLAERRKQISGSMSGGEQQMLAIGRALMSKPAMILLDEPSQGLAPLLVEAIGKIVTELNALGVTIILVEQGVDFAFSICNYTYVFDLGRIVLEGKPEDLLKDERVQNIYLGHN